MVTHTFTSTGLIVLLGSGVQTVWAFWQIYAYYPAGYIPMIEKDFFTIGSWYITSIIGTAIAAVLLKNWSKKRLYVSQNEYINYRFYLYQDLDDTKK